MKYTWLLFDADGTLFDYDRAEAIALARALEETGQRCEPRHHAAYRQINGEIWKAFEQGRITPARLRVKRFELLFEALSIRSDPAQCSARYLAHLAECADLIAGAQATIRALHGKVGLMLITNGLRDVQRSRLARSTIGNYFADIVISEEVGAAKPDGAIFDVAFSRMNDPRKEEVLIIGDSLTSDIKGGNDYGIDTCWFNPVRLPRRPDVLVQYEISRLDELLSIVAGAHRPAESLSE